LTTDSAEAYPKANQTKRHYGLVDQFLSAIDHARLTLSDSLPTCRPLPIDTLDDPQDHPNDVSLTSAECSETASYLRVNHTGEVCAQALYLGQASVAKAPETKSHLLHCAEEEQAHLQWCAERLNQLNAKPSRLNPLWYLMSYFLGAGVAKLSDQVSLGFIHATENQVKRHLEEHLEKIPPHDRITRSILSTMLKEEIEHADAALRHGGKTFPGWVQSFMWLTSRVMTVTSSRI